MITQLRSVAAALALALAAAGCAAAPERPPHPNPLPKGGGQAGPVAPAASAAAPRPPIEAPAGAFSWREIQGGKDQLTAFCDLRDRAVAVLDEGARFPGAGGADSPAARLAAAARQTFDETRAPEELEARVVYFDRARRDESPVEGVEVRLRRRSARDGQRELRLTLEDTAHQGWVDGVLDRLAIRWNGPPPGPAGGRLAAPPRLAIDIAPEGGRLLEHVAVAGEPSYQITSPHLAALLDRAQSELYLPLCGPAFARAVRDGTAPLMVRPAAPRGTSFRAE